ncbi:uncharacterized protein BJ212DRAFT_1448738 [Suillus subaureus]|uniref:Uncharacterized protein n=1 Tax=Suillus subaureus TaxID=48587 RepID=A0A9P7J9G8_9AGAM|nr:uncharacterized protein BJ212DRAFT_1448738 [Suillus subaureus]KAG1809643.1 hypothetical protein BJ212DRAFT_1448738 [Suillus subaureus]
MDNASNNDTFMLELEIELEMRGIPFDHADLHVYTNTLSNEPVGQCHGIVNACRHSGQHHCWNNNGYWKGKLPDDKETLPVLWLLQDCLTCWSSTFKMIDRVLTLHPAIQSFLQEIQNVDIAHLSMDLKDIDVLCDIHQIIEVPHAAPELLTSKHTPTLSMAIPAYELLQTKWTKLKGTIWELAHYIEIGLDKLSNYIHQGRKTQIYTLAMIINLSLKLE